MKKVLEQIGIALGSVAAVTVLTVAPAAAHGGEDHMTPDSSTTASNQMMQSGNAPAATDNQSGSGKRAEQHSGKRTTPNKMSPGADDNGEAGHQAGRAADDDKDSLQVQAQQLLNTQRQKGKQRSVAERQKSCEARKAGIDKRFANLGDRASTILGNYNAIHVQIVAYQTKQQLNVSNYGALEADAAAKQAAASTAVKALSDLKGKTIDCTANDPAATVATVKTATSNARTSLQAYRESLKTLIKALLAAKDDTSGNYAKTGDN